LPTEFAGNSVSDLCGVFVAEPAAKRMASVQKFGMGMNSSVLAELNKKRETVKQTTAARDVSSNYSQFFCF